MEKSKVCMAVFVIVSSFFWSSCENIDYDNNMEIIEQIELDDGGYVHFLSSETGELLVASVSKENPEILVNKSPVEIYESLTGKTAPRRLVEASRIEYEYNDTGEDNENEENDFQTPVNDVDASEIASENEMSKKNSMRLTFAGRMSAEEFIERYGFNYGDQTYLWTDVTGTGWAKSKCYTVSTDLVALRGKAIHKVQYKNSVLSKWKTVYAQVVPMGYRSHIMYGTSKKKRKKCYVYESPDSSRPVLYHAKIAFNK
ncbi:MAG: hypothetical protein JXK07_14835 [Spirochaetes bacterium]|nr:hypothetical protein [Spirochaetota bacterium]MBN2769931.1 hypothetical protein [Spirochaetota bacterium]